MEFSFERFLKVGFPFWSIIFLELPWVWQMHTRDFCVFRVSISFICWFYVSLNFSTSSICCLNIIQNTLVICAVLYFVACTFSQYLDPWCRSMRTVRPACSEMGRWLFSQLQTPFHSFWAYISPDFLVFRSKAWIDFARLTSARCSPCARSTLHLWVRNAKPTKSSNPFPD